MEILIFSCGIVINPKPTLIENAHQLKGRCHSCQGKEGQRGTVRVPGILLQLCTRSSSCSGDYIYKTKCSITVCYAYSFVNVPVKTKPIPALACVVEAFTSILKKKKQKKKPVHYKGLYSQGTLFLALID